MSHLQFDQATIKNSYDMRVKANKVCYEECHFQKQTLAGEMINHTVYECLHKCAAKYQKSYQLVADTLHNHCNQDSGQIKGFDLQMFEGKSD